MDEELISVVMAVRSSVESTMRAVDSILAQTDLNWELLLVLNGVEESCRVAVEAACASDTRLRCLESGVSGGLIEALNLGLKHSRGGYIARMDADDVCSPRRLALQRKALEEEADWGACACGVEIPNAHDGNQGMQAYVAWVNGLQEPADHFRERFIESPVVHPTVMMRRGAWEALGVYRDGVWAEDYDLWLRFLEGGGRLGKISDVLYGWMDSSDRLTRCHARYSSSSMLRCKAHFIACLQGVPRPFALCGAGPIGKELLRYLLEEEVDVAAFYEVHPGRIGERISGVPVRSHEELHAFKGTVLSAVGQVGGRGRVRGLLCEEGFEEGVNFFCVA